MADQESTSQQAENTSPINTYDRAGVSEGDALRVERMDDSPVGVYDKPEGTDRTSPSAWTIIMVLALLALVAYFLVQFVF